MRFVWLARERLSRRRALRSRSWRLLGAVRLECSQYAGAGFLRDRVPVDGLREELSTDADLVGEVLLVGRLLPDEKLEALFFGERRREGVGPVGCCVSGLGGGPLRCPLLPPDHLETGLAHGLEILGGKEVGEDSPGSWLHRPS